MLRESLNPGPELENSQGQIRKDAPRLAMDRSGTTTGRWWALFKLQWGGRVDAQCLDQARFGRWQQLREDCQIAAAGGSKPQRRIRVDADQLPCAWPQPTAGPAQRDLLLDLIQ